MEDFSIDQFKNLTEAMSPLPLKKVENKEGQIQDLKTFVQEEIPSINLPDQFEFCNF